MRTAPRIEPGPASRVGVAFLLLALVAGCQARNRSADSASETKTAAAEKPAATEKSAGGKHASQAKTTVAVHAEPEPELQAGPANHVYLSDRTCVHFEPHWATVHVGQGLTVTSRLKVPVTLHVMSGAFEKSAFVLKPGETVTTGPAHDAGKFTMWTEPAACQEIPRGGEGAPGVIVEGASSHY
jgi:hypothetical protein